MNELVTMGFNSLVEAEIFWTQNKGDFIRNWFEVVDSKGIFRKAGPQDSMGSSYLGEI